MIWEGYAENVVLVCFLMDLVDTQVFMLVLFLRNANTSCTPLCGMFHSENNYIIQGHTHQRIELVVIFPLLKTLIFCRH